MSNQLIIDELTDKIDKFNKNVDEMKNEIIEILNVIINNIEKYYEINKNIKESYKGNNYTILKNIEVLNNYNKKVIKDIDEILNERKIELKFKKLKIIYDKMTNNQINSNDQNKDKN